MKKRLLSLLCALALCLSLLPGTALAADSVSYVEYSWNEERSTLTSETRSVSDYTTVTSSVTAWGTSGQTTWYVVSDNVDNYGRSNIEVSGTVNLILTSGKTLTLNGPNISLQDSSAVLNIYGQAGNTGKLSITAGNSSGDAGINLNGGTLNIHGGTVTATGPSPPPAISLVLANQPRASTWAPVPSPSTAAKSPLRPAPTTAPATAPASGWSPTARSTSTAAPSPPPAQALLVLTTIPALASAAAAITGGTVTANGGDGYQQRAAAGIGGGAGNSSSAGGGGTVIISGGTVTANGGKASRNDTVQAPGIGGAVYSSSSGGAGTFSTGTNGSAVITTTGGIQTGTRSCSAIIDNKVYGNVTLPDSQLSSKNLTVTNGATLTISGEKTLSSSITVNDGGTLTVSGTVTNSGTITVESGGTLTGTGTINNTDSGKVTGNTGNVKVTYPSTVEVSSSTSGTAVLGQEVTFTATVTGNDTAGTPTGTVQFKDGETNLGEAVALEDGVATYTANNGLDVGEHPITAEYTPAGDAAYTGSSGSLTFTVVGDVASISVQTQPTTMTYTTGQALDLTGLVITLHYDGTDYTSEVSWGTDSGITSDPENGMELQASEHNGKAVTITYEGKTATTATLAVYETPQQTDGVYQIGTAGELFWFAALVNGTLEGMTQNTAANAVLTADIDLSGSKWTPIAPSATFKSDATSVAETTDKSYSGTFDGQGHTISNFEIRTNSAEKTSGLFGTVTGTIQNLGIANASFDNGGDYDGRFGALCGLLAKDDDIETAATIQNCYVVGSSIATTGKIAGAVCGANYGGTIKDCYECGNTVTAHNRIGHLVGDNQNDYNNSSTPWRTLKGIVTNCYSDTQLAGTQGGTVNGGGVKDADDFASGAVAYLLNGSTSEGSLAWFQNLDNNQTKDNYPVLDNSHGTVYCIIEEEPTRYSNDPNATTEPTDISSATVTLSPESFTYNGQSQRPTVTVTLGDKTLTEGTHYTVTYSGEGINVSSYSVTVAGDGKYYTGTASSQPSYTISPATPTLTWSDTSQVLGYTGSPVVITAPTVTLVNGEIYSGEISYQYKAEGTDDYTNGLPTDVGTYTVVASIAAQGNYTAASGELTLTIKKAAASGTAFAVAGLTYNGQAQELVTAGTATGGTMQYSTEENGTYSTDIPTGTNAGDYTVWYKVGTRWWAMRTTATPSR